MDRKLYSDDWNELAFSIEDLVNWCCESFGWLCCTTLARRETAIFRRLLTALRDQAQNFSIDQKDEANDALDDLERDLAEEQPDQGRIGRRLKKLVAILQGRGFANATTLTIGAIAFPAGLAQLDDALNVLLPQIEQVQPDLAAQRLSDG